MDAVEPDFDYERVADGCECPVCGEDAMDCLVYDDQDWVHCATCGTIYDPATGEVRHWGEVE
jgi:rubredoxin